MDGWMDVHVCMYVCGSIWQASASFVPEPGPAATLTTFRGPPPRAHEHTNAHTHRHTHTHTHAHTETERQTNSACLFHAELKHSPCQHHFLASEHTSELTKKGHDHRTLGVSWSQTVKPKSRELACSNMLRNVASHAKTPRHR